MFNGLRLVFTGDGVGVMFGCHKSPSDLVNIENRNHKRSHVRMVLFSSNSAYVSDAYDPVKTGLPEL